MSKLVVALLAGFVAVTSTTVLAADPPKAADAKAAPAKLEKPAGVTAEAWAKMSDADKQKAVDAAKKPAAAAPAAAAPAKKEKKGGC